MINELVTVIMSTYNEKAEWVEKSILSILEQTYSNLELIIIIDNPNNIIVRDLIQQYKNKDKRIKVVENEKNIGLVNSLNKALEVSSGKYIARMDADDISALDRLEREMEFLVENNLDFVFSSVLVIDEQGNKLYSTDKREINYEYTKRLLEKGNISKHPTWFLKREVYDKLNGYRHIPYCEDYDFILRSLEHKFKLGKMGDNLLEYRMRNNSISRSYSLEQFLISRGLKILYKKSLLENYDSIIRLMEKINISKKEKDRYESANKLFNLGVTLLKRKRIIKGTFFIFRSIIINRYLKLRLLDIAKFKLYFNIYKIRGSYNANIRSRKVTF